MKYLYKQLGFFFGIQGLGFRIWGLGSRDLGFRIYSLGISRLWRVQAGGRVLLQKSA